MSAPLDVSQALVHMVGRPQRRYSRALALHDSILVAGGGEFEEVDLPLKTVNIEATFQTSSFHKSKERASMETKLYFNILFDTKGRYHQIR